MLLDAMTGKPERCEALTAVDLHRPWRRKAGLKHRVKEHEKEKGRGRRRAQEDKTPGAQSPFATKNLGFATTAGIPSHKPAEKEQRHVLAAAPGEI